MTVIGELSVPVLSSTHKPFVMFSLPSPVEERGDSVALVTSWCPATVNPPHMDRTARRLPVHSNFHRVQALNYWDCGLKQNIKLEKRTSMLPVLQKLLQIDQHCTWAAKAAPQHWMVLRAQQNFSRSCWLSLRSQFLNNLQKQWNKGSFPGLRGKEW